MSHSASPPPALYDLIRPAALAQFDQMLDLLAQDGPLDAASVHAIRRSVKRIRALLQLVRSGLNSRFGEWDKLLQSVNRSLSTARDLEVCLQSVRHLAAHASPRQRTVLDRVSAELSQRQSILMLSRDPADVRPELSAQLETVKAGFGAWQPESAGFRLIKPSLRRMSRKARRIIDRLRQRVTGDELHSLRKVVKLRLYWLETLAPVWPRGFGAERNIADALSDRLGEHHDLEVLIGRLHESEVAGDPALHHAARRVVHRLKQRQQKLERHSIQLARRLFAERPQALTKRWRSLIKVWRDSSPEMTVDQAAAINDPSPRLLRGESA